MNLSEIKWDINLAGTWPLPVKAGITLIICSIVFGAGIYLDTVKQIEDLDKLEKKEKDLKTTFEDKQKKASTLDDQKIQLKQIEVSLDEMIRQMPTEEEVASLLIDISQSGLASGLEFKSFKPNPSVRKDFYSELPITIEVLGTYKEFALFVSSLASLPRVVTVHDVAISADKKPVKTSSGLENMLLMKATIKTYNEGSKDVAADDTKKGKKDKKKDKDKGKK